MRLFNNIFGKKRISLAVVGAPSSGKSYFITDLIASLGAMDCTTYDLKGYRSFGLYERDVTLPADGNTPDQTGEQADFRPRTDLYACRQPNHYGAVVQNPWGNDFELDFLNIPGEVFNSTATVLNDYFNVRRELLKKGKIFRLVTWKNDFDHELIVEPLITASDAARQAIERAKNWQMPANKEARKAEFDSWGEIFAGINRYGRNLTEETKKVKEVTAKELLGCLMDVNIDSAMRSIAEVVAALPNIDMTGTDFMTKLSRQFYFLNYCSQATDIVVCDKMILPPSSNAAVSADQNSEQALQFSALTRDLDNFFQQDMNHKPHVYTTYRGADVLLKACEEDWRALSDALTDYTGEQRRNIFYALTALLIFRHCNPNRKLNITQESLAEILGFNTPDDMPWDPAGKDILEFLHDLYVDFATADRMCMTGGTLARLIEAHDNNMAGMMNYAYGPHQQVQEEPLTFMRPHTYFTATPITQDLLVFRNDDKSKNQRFIHDAIAGQQRYFDNYSSHLCFGTYQLCLDMLRQHGLRSQGCHGTFYYYLFDS